MIETEDLSKHFGDFHAVDGISITVQPGQIMALLGQNGAGKTTTIRMLTTVLTPTRGWARLAGYDVVQYAQKVCSMVGVLTEQHGLFLRMSGEEYLDFFGQIYHLDLRVRKKRTKELLDYFDLGYAGTRPIGQYSKGMRQKLALARTLLHEPPVLLFDEPTSAMDPDSARLVRSAIANLRSTNRTIIICTHNLVEAELLADHIAIIFKGRILKQGTLAELKHALFGPAEFQLQVDGGWQWGNLNPPAGVTLLEGSNREPRFKTNDPNHDNPILLKQLIDAGVNVVSMHEKPCSLEDIYLAAMEAATHAQDG